jgi:2,4-dienoyl-CoA reductase-like NADH-dependent reductase (Old Yellow Enzyme family)
MYEHLADFFGGPPNSGHLSLYSRWAKGGWGMLFTGNVQVDSHHLTLGRDFVMPTELSEDSILPFKQLAAVMHGDCEDDDRPLAIMQLSHAGRQSSNFIGGRPLFSPPSAPSAVPLGRTGKEGWLGQMLYRLMFTTPKAMDKEELDQVVASFVQGAKLAHMSGFDGIELHASHGCKY